MHRSDAPLPTAPLDPPPRAHADAVRSAAIVEPESYTLVRGSSPLLVSIPHCGREIPQPLQADYVDRALQLEDTDWYLERLYGFVVKQGASLLLPRYSRYVIDLNRPSEDTPMYPGRNNTGLCPLTFFTGEPLYRSGREPDAQARVARVQRYWRPYHEALDAELARLQAQHGHAVLFDAHSIRSELPWLFDGTLPHLNLGTVQGRSCAASLRARLLEICSSTPAFTHVADERFKGGFITRQHGRPQEGRHAVQLEMCWRTYMDESPIAWNEARARQVTPLLQQLVGAMVAWRPA